MSLAVLIDRNPNFRPDKYEFKLDGFELVMKFPVVKLLEYKGKEEELEGGENPFGLVTLVWLRSGLEVSRRLEEKERMLRELARLWLKRGWEKERLRKLVIFIDNMMKLPRELERKLKMKMREEVGEMARMLSPLFEEEYKEGIKEGLLRSLEVMLRMKFGIEGLKLLPELKKLSVEKLEVIVKAMPELENLNQLKELMK